MSRLLDKTINNMMEKKAGSRDDFLMNYSTEIREAISQLREMKSKLEQMDEDDPKWDKIDQELRNYDTNVNQAIQSWAWRVPDAGEIARFAIDNMNRWGTEPQMVVFAINDFYRALMR